MDLRNDLICINCGKVMRLGGLWACGSEIINYRDCECGLNVIFYTTKDGYEYGLHRQKEGSDVYADKRLIEEMKTAFRYIADNEGDTAIGAIASRFTD